jgi:hypothetical protein
MRKITVNGLELACDDNVELSIEGNKVTIKASAAPANVQNVVHEHHYHYNATSLPPLTSPHPPYITTPIYPTPGAVTWGTVGSAASPGNPPATSGYVQVIDGGPGSFLDSGNMQLADGTTVLSIN